MAAACQPPCEGKTLSNVFDKILIRKRNARQQLLEQAKPFTSQNVTYRGIHVSMILTFQGGQLLGTLAQGMQKLHPLSVNLVEITANTLNDLLKRVRYRGRPGFGVGVPYNRSRCMN